MGKKDGRLTSQRRQCQCHCQGHYSGRRCSLVCQVGEGIGGEREREREESILEGDAVVEVVNGIEMMVTASCSVNEDKVKELSPSGEFKGGQHFARDSKTENVGSSRQVRRSISVQTLISFPFKAESTT